MVSLLTAGPSLINDMLDWHVLKVATKPESACVWHHQSKKAHHTAVAGPYNKIQNWDYVKHIESMDNGNDQSWAVRVCCSTR